MRVDKLKNNCNTCIYRVQFEQVDKSGHIINICYFPDGLLEDKKGGVELYEVSHFDSEECTLYENNQHGIKAKRGTPCRMG